MAKRGNAQAVSETKKRDRDPAVEAFEGAVKDLYQGKLEEAGRKFETLAATDLPELAASARQYLAVVRARMAKAPAPREGDPYVEAVVLKNKGHLSEALELCRANGNRDDRFLYLAASIHALLDRPSEAVQVLSQAIAANPVNRVHAFHDPDFAELRQRSELAGIFGLG